MSKFLKYTIGIFILVLFIYLSLDIRNLEEHKANSGPDRFSPIDYAAQFWNDSIPVCISNASELSIIMELLNENPEEAIEKYGRKLGISKTYYFLARGKGIVKKIDPEYVELLLDDQTIVKIATDFIFGNAVRDASGKVNINDFLNMTDFNNVSVAINNLIKENVVTHLRNSAAVGKTLEFAGAMEIHKENIDLSNVILIPVSVKFADGQEQ